MTTHKKIVSTSKAPPVPISLFGPPPLLEGEDPKAYKQLLADVTDCVAPADILEQIWANGVVQQTW